MKFLVRAAATAAAMLALVMPATPQGTVRGKPREFKGVPIPYTVVLKGSQSGVHKNWNYIFRSAKKFDPYWKSLGLKGVKKPKIDFKKDALLAMHLGPKPTTGYAVDLISIQRIVLGTLIRYNTKAPAPGKINATMITHPFLIVKIKAPKRATIFDPNAKRT
jgi:hypothetical protein